MIITKMKFDDLQRPSLNLHRLAPTRDTLSTAWRTGIQLGMLQGVENYIWDLERYLSQIWRASQNNWGRCKKIHLTFCQENVRHKLGLVVKTTFQVCLLPRLLPGWASKNCLSLRPLVQVQASNYFENQLGVSFSFHQKCSKTQLEWSWNVFYPFSDVPADRPTCKPVVCSHPK